MGGVEGVTQVPERGAKAQSVEASRGWVWGGSMGVWGLCPRKLKKTNVEIAYFSAFLQALCSGVKAGLTTNKNTRFRLIPKSMTLNDLWARFKVIYSLNVACRVAGCIISVRHT